MNQFTKDDQRWIAKLATRGLSLEQIAMVLSIPATKELAEAVQLAQAKGVQRLAKASKPGLYDQGLQGEDKQWLQVMKMLESEESMALTQYMTKKKWGNR